MTSIFGESQYTYLTDKGSTFLYDFGKIEICHSEHLSSNTKHIETKSSNKPKKEIIKLNVCFIGDILISIN